MPYQLQARIAGQVDEIAELDDGTDELAGNEEDLAEELTDIELDDWGAEDEERLLEATSPQIDPVTTGVSIAAPFAFT